MQVCLSLLASFRTRLSSTMQNVRLSTGLLIAAASLFLSSVSAERVTTCEGDWKVHILNCESGVIKVESALYGRADKETCNEARPQELANTHCSLPGVEEKVRRRCDGKKKCDVSRGDLGTTDPCRGTFKYLDTNYTCEPAFTVTACEGSLAYLQCFPGQIISVYGADYGRRDKSTCAYKLDPNDVQKVDCSRPTSKVAESCNGENSCSIKASNFVFGDPCIGIYKYLEVSYFCEYPLTDPYLSQI